MSRIFISYKRVDKDKVFKIKDQIESALGEKCWIDLDGIDSNEDLFDTPIINAIIQCEIVLFMYSRAHTEIEDFKKDWTVRELNFAEKKNKKIVFINIDGSELIDQFEFRYGTKQQVDAMSSNAMNKLYTDLRVWLNITDILHDAKGHNNQNDEVNVIVSPSDFVGPNFNKDYIPNFENKESKLDMLDALKRRLSSNGDGDLYECFRYGYMDKNTYYEQRNNFGKIDKSKYVIVSESYEHCGRFFEGFACVMLKNKKWNIIDMLDNAICKDIEAEYVTSTRLKRKSLPLFKIKHDNKWGLIDLKGNVLLECIYDDLLEKNEGMLSCKRYGKWCLMNEDLIQLTDFSFDEIRFFNSGEAEASMNGDGLYATWGILKNNGDFRKWNAFEKMRKLRL